MKTETTTTTTATRKMRTLIVDDQVIQREVIRLLLRHESDIEIVGTSENGREAVASIQKLNPDLVFMDVQMPELDGFGVVSEIGQEHMPNFIFVTANESLADRASAVHAVDYLLKPCTKARFQCALQRAREKFQNRSITATS
ncbi:MAG: response regulator [Verrucomicrobiota bacterium]